MNVTMWPLGGLALLLPAVLAAEEVPGRHLALGLDSATPAHLGTGFAPEDGALQPTKQVKPVAAPTGGVSLSFSWNPAALPPELGFLLPPPPPGVTTVTERAVEAETWRTMDDGIPGGVLPNTLIMVSVTALVRTIASAVTRARARRRARDAREAADSQRSLELLVNEGDGGVAPAVVTALPLVEGRVGDVLTGTCSAAGRCVVEGFPVVADAVLLRGRGGAVVAVPKERTPLPVHLAATGTLYLRRSNDDRALIRVESADGVPVPVHPAANPGRGEWFAPSPLPLVLPAGRYTVEVERAGELEPPFQVELAGGQTLAVAVPPPAPAT